MTTSQAEVAEIPPRHNFYRTELQRLVKARKAASDEHLDPEADKWLAFLVKKAGEEALARLKADLEWACKHYRKQRARAYVAGFLARCAQERGERDELSRRRARLSRCEWH